MRAAVLFPGQGEAVAPVLGHWLEHSRAVRTLMERAARGMGLSVEALVEKGGRRLRSTAVLQPVSAALSLGILRELLDRGLIPTVVAGHSLGELSAVAAAGGLTPAAAVEVATVRGRAMGREAARFPGGMVALPTSRPEAVASALARGREAGTLVIAAYNGPHQTVLSGTAPALARVPPPITRLPVEGAWHSPAMEGAREEFGDALSAAMTRGFACPVLLNANGRPAADISDAARRLAQQLVSPIRWDAVLGTLDRLSPSAVITVGPSRSLRGLVRDGLRTGIPVFPVERYGDLERCLEGAAA